MLKEVKVEEAQKWFKILGYGAPSVGKTAWATAYPEAWGDAVYVAYDEDSERLDSVITKYRPRIHVVKPEGDDPILNLNEVAIHNWRAEYPTANVLIIDTFSRAVKEVLFYVAKKGYFSSRKEGKDDLHMVFGPKDAEITHALPVEGDYGGVQSMIFNWLRLMFHHQSGMHVIILTHEGEGTPKKGGQYVGGPATVGKALLRDFAQDFPIVVRLKMQSAPAIGGNPPKTERVALADMHGDFIARIREGSGKGNPMPSVRLGVDPGNWWAEAIAKGVLR